MTITLIIISLIVGAVGCYFCFKPKLTHIEQVNTETRKTNESLEKAKSILNNEIQSLKLEAIKLEEKKKNLFSNIEDLQQQAENNSKRLYESGLELANERMSAAADSMAREYQSAKLDAEQEYLNDLKELSETYMQELNKYNRELKTNKSLLEDLTAKVKAATEAAKRQEEMDIKQDFYRVQLSDIDLLEIEKLRSILPYLRDSEPLNKVIWKVYYEKPTTDMTGRVLGDKRVTGIYKITNTLNKKCYIGQSVDIRSRLSQHIKRALGAETPTKNKLYPIMAEVGVENFTFELVEECPSGKLDEREQYWQEYFSAKTFGYSIK